MAQLKSSRSVIVKRLDTYAKVNWMIGIIVGHAKQSVPLIFVLQINS